MIGIIIFNHHMQNRQKQTHLEQEQVDMSGPPYLLRVQYIEILKPVSKSLSLFEARVNNFKVKSYNNPFRGSKMVLSQGDCIK